MSVLEVKDFAQIEEARIEFGDLTVLVGPQASGKSLILQWLKLALDVDEVKRALKEAGHDVGTEANLLDLAFGEGMSKAWREGRTSVSFDDRPIRPKSWPKRKVSVKSADGGRLFYIPAHRALLLAEGWPAPFLKLNADTPVVARLFSQNLYQRFSGRKAEPLFPVFRGLRREYRDSIDKSVFHGAQVRLENEGLRYSLRLKYEETSLPFMTWTAGQREFTPLLLGLYHLLPPQKTRKRAEIDWVVIEEPEMGLHPQAVSTVMLLALDLLWRGYKVVVSTHSPLVLDVIWAIRILKGRADAAAGLASAFGVDPSEQIRRVTAHALEAEHRVFYMEIDPATNRARSHDISNLDPDSDDPLEAGWGGLTAFSSGFGEVVRKAVNGGSH